VQPNSRDLGIDSGIGHQVTARGVAKIRPLTREQRDELRELTGAIEKRRLELKDDDGKTLLPKPEDLAKKAGHGVSTWYAWRRKRPTSPKFFDLRDFARAVGLDVRVVSQDASTTTGMVSGGVEASELTRQIRQLITTMESLPEDLQQDILDYAERHAHRWGGKKANPSEPGWVLDEGTYPVRHK
jgi:hypothetical protein